MTQPRVLPELEDVAPAQAVEEYERWLAGSASDDAYLYTDLRVRFDARDDDVLVQAPDLSIETTGTSVVMRTQALESGIDLSVLAEPLRRFLDLCDGERTLGSARRDSGLAASEIDRILAGAFGTVLFSPLAVAELDQRIPASEIVRFPGSPYEIPRNYWGNMASVRNRLGALFDRSDEPLRALDELRALHVVTLLGDDGKTFYRPASRIAEKGILPGTLWRTPSRTLETPGGTRFVEGPRVNATFLGGDVYGSLLAELAGDPDATAARREHRDADGLDWGRIVRGRAEADPDDAEWFCPPRPITIEHVESLFQSLSLALVSGDASDPVHAADFHQKFVRLHPFRAANQSLAMNIVNDLLTQTAPVSRAGLTTVGMPHLILDHLALRLAPDAYRRVFALATWEWTTPYDSGAERLRFYADRKRRAFSFIKRLASASDAAEARSMARAEPRDARVALLFLAPSDYAART
jgi:hypothetical protein